VATADDQARKITDVGGKIVLGTPKSHLARTVPLPRFLAAELAAFVAGKSPDDLVFTTASGSMVRLSNWRQAVFLPARRKAGISDRFRIHDLRHTAAALMVQAGYPPKMLQAILGHASITTTLGICTGTCTPATWTSTQTASTMRPPTRVRPKYGQTKKKTARRTHDRAVYLHKHLRARRDSNPQPSDP
jgi:Phage integrase family